MPIYVYRAKNPEQACPACFVALEVMQKIADPSLNTCPECGNVVERVITPPNIATKGTLSPTSESDIAKHGFTQYRRAAKGVYEKTAGKGPDTIMDDGK